MTTTGIDDRPTLEALAARVRCPALVIHGTDDAVTGYRHGVDLSRLVRGQVLALRGAGHIPLARDPVAVNLALRAFTESLPARQIG